MNHAINTFNQGNQNKDNLNILIIGGGDGRVARCLLDNYKNNINKIIDVEIDIEVSKVCRD